jgi:hypothetical protein
MGSQKDVGRIKLNKKAIRQILHDDLRKRKTYAKFVSHRLKDEWKQRRLASCQDCIQTCQDNPSFLDCTLTGDELWVFQYDPEMKCQNIQWTSKSSSKPKIFRLQKTKIKTMVIIFDKQGVILTEFVSERQIVNSAFCVEVIWRSLKRISPVKLQFRADDNLFLLHDNAHFHSALVAMKHFWPNIVL